LERVQFLPIGSQVQPHLEACHLMKCWHDCLSGLILEFSSIYSTGSMEEYSD
jgi:hypothetical protein